MEPPCRTSRRSKVARPRVALVNESGRRVPASLLRRAVSAALCAHGLNDSRVCVLIGSDERIRELNRRFRGLDEATDVLTFPSGLPAPAPLGDIAIAAPYAARQAAARPISFEHELAFLAIHGALHLAGQDDEDPRDRARMVDEMNRVAASLGLAPDDEWGSILHEAARPPGPELQWA